MISVEAEDPADSVEEGFIDAEGEDHHKFHIAKKVKGMMLYI